jgi:hypothetical protein
MDLHPRLATKRAAAFVSSAIAKGCASTAHVLDEPMSIPCKFEPIVLSYYEHEITLPSHHREIYETGLDDLKTLASVCAIRPTRSPPTRSPRKVTPVVTLMPCSDAIPATIETKLGYPKQSWAIAG